MQIFGLMNLIIDRLGDSVKPFAEGLLRLLPGVWQDAEGQSLLRIQVTAAPSTLPSPFHPCLTLPCRRSSPLSTPLLSSFYLSSPPSTASPLPPTHVWLLSLLLTGLSMGGG